MKANDDAFDAMLRESLTREEAELFERLGKPSVFDLITDLFRGSMRWINVMGYVLGMIIMGLGVFALLAFLRADDVPTMLRAALAFGSCLLVLVMLKIWFWSEMHQYATMREMKRLQLQVAHLQTQLRQLDPAATTTTSSRLP